MTRILSFQGMAQTRVPRDGRGWPAGLGKGLLYLWLIMLLWSGGHGGSPVRAQAETEEEALREHTVQEGDTLLQISALYAVPVQVIQVLNGLEGDANLIVVGQTLLIPRLAQPEPACLTWYVVEAGDSLWGIAASFGWTVEDLSRVNGIGDQDFIAEGQRLCVARPEADDAGTNAPLTDPQAFPWVIHTAESFWYTVNLGDTLEWIALRYNKTPDEIREANELDLETTVIPGQILRIPGKATLAEGPTAEQPWTARYYPVADLTGAPALLRYEEAITHNWFNGSPDPSLPADSFSARWEGEFAFDDGVYRFIGIADHGVRIYLGDRLVLDNWSPSAELVPYADVEVEAGVQAVRVEYQEQTGAALIYVIWFLASATDLP